MVASWSLAGRTALVTGGSRGLGFAIASALAGRGANVAIISRKDADVKTAASLLESTHDGAAVLPIVADATDDDAVKAALTQVQEWKGGLNILVNNAGPQLAPTPVTDADDAVLTAAMDTKLLGFLRFSRAALPLLGESGHGAIVNVAGATAHVPIPNTAVTGIVNTAVVALTSFLASEAAAQGVRVNAISPGMTKTEGWLAKNEAAANQQGITPDEVRAGVVKGLGIRLGRWAEPSEIGNAVAFLASDDASYMTGQVLRVDGGLSKPVA